MNRNDIVNGATWDALRILEQRLFALFPHTFIRQNAGNVYQIERRDAPGGTSLVDAGPTVLLTAGQSKGDE